MQGQEVIAANTFIPVTPKSLSCRRCILEQRKSPSPSSQALVRSPSPETAVVNSWAIPSNRGVPSFGNRHLDCMQQTQAPSQLPFQSTCLTQDAITVPEIRSQCMQIQSLDYVMMMEGSWRCEEMTRDWVRTGTNWVTRCLLTLWTRSSIKAAKKNPICWV